MSENGLEIEERIVSGKSAKKRVVIHEDDVGMSHGNGVDRFERRDLVADG